MESGNELPRQVENKLVSEIIEMRFKQTTTDRLVEYLTGLSFGNPELVDRLEEDQNIIRTKYGLPDRNYGISNTSDYEAFLRNKAKDTGIIVREKSDCGELNKVSCTAAFIPDSKSIGINIDKTDRKKYLDGLVNFEHELIHSLQNKFYPQMPIEQEEYEAYVAGLNIDDLKNDSKQTISDLFGSPVAGIYCSINHWYRETSKETGSNIEPLWDNAEYFLKNIDGINDEQIKKYVDKTIKFRFEQDKIERLVEQLTDLKIDDPKLIDKLKEDQLEIILKYNLPKRDLIFNNPNGYEEYLKHLAENNGIKIGAKDEYVNFLNGLKLDEKSKLEAAYANKMLFFDFNILNNKDQYIENLHNFEHGILIILQGIKGIEIKLYEDCLLDLNVDNLRDNKNGLYTFFENISNKSISFFKEKKMLPFWMNPENFLKSRDRINDEQIKKYKEKQSLDNVRV